MLRSVNGLAGYAISATDSEIGRVLEVRYDPSRWAVSALVVDVGHPVMISPRLLGPIDDARRVVAASLTRAQILASPHPETDKRARSARDLTRHFAQGLDQEIGRVADLLVDDQTWVVRHLIVALEDLDAGRGAAVPVGWVSWVSDEARTVILALRSAVVERAPHFDTSSPRADDARLVAHYGRPPFTVTG